MLFMIFMAYLQTRSKVKEATHKVIIQYRDDPDLQNAIDGIQKGLKCCGGYSYHDWELNEHFNCSAKTVQACGVPFSCCLEVSMCCGHLLGFLSVGKGFVKSSRIVNFF